MKLRNGDHVVVISGKDKGKTGTVLRVLHNKDRLVIGGINMRVKHVRGTPQQPGQRLEYEASIAVSNVMLIDPKTKKRTRIGSAIDEKGKKNRIAKRSGEVLPTTKAGSKTLKKDSAKTNKSSSSKATKETKEDKKTLEKEIAEVKEVKKEVVAQEGKKPPTKKPFWKRVINFSDDLEGEGEAKPDHTIPKDNPPAHRTTSRGS